MKVLHSFSMRSTLARLLVAFTFVLGALPATQAAAAKPPASPPATHSAAAEQISPQGLLKPDGTLALDGSFSGSLDISSWSVQLDADHGPVFSPAAAAATGEWADVGGGGTGPITGSVRAMVVDGTHIYIGGRFTDAANLPAADYVVMWDGANWSALGSNGFGDGSLNNEVDALAIDGSGHLYAGGWFTNVHNGLTQLPAADNIAMWDGTGWSALGSGSGGNGALNMAVSALAVYGTNVYAGGYFTDVDNGGTSLTAADYIAKFDGTDWHALSSDGGTPAHGSLNSLVYALAVDGAGHLYVGGNFTDVNDAGTPVTAADYVVEWDGANWLALGNNGLSTPHGSLNGQVTALAISGTTVYAGGMFTQANNRGTTLTTAARIAKWDGTNWLPLGDPRLNASVQSIVVDGSSVYVAGPFNYVTNAGEFVPEARYVAKWNGSAWSALGGNGAGSSALTGPTAALAMAGGQLFAGGDFPSVNNAGTILPNAAFLARWDGADWSGLSAMEGSLSNRVNAVVVDGTDVYVGGNFQNVGNHGLPILAADYIARWDGSDWSALGSNGYGESALGGEVLAIAVAPDGTVYAGGSFSYTLSLAGSNWKAARLAKFDGSVWSELSDDGAGESSINGPVQALAFVGSDLYAGGQFSDVNDGGVVIPEADYIARWDGSNWHALSSNGLGDGALNGHVFALVPGAGGSLYAAGDFFDVSDGGVPLPAADRVARWDGTHWWPLGSNGAGDGALNASVKALAVRGTDVYVGGAFTNVGGAAGILPEADYVARWDGAAWHALAASGATDGALNGEVASITLVGPDVYVGGKFTDVNNAGTLVPQADYVARWDGSSWSALGSNGAADGAIPGAVPSPTINALAASGTQLYAGGYFFNVSNNGAPLPYADHFAAYGITLPTVTISGNAGVGSATLSYHDGSDQTAAADSNGHYSFAVSYGWSGTVTPSKTYYTFSPPSRTYDTATADQSNQDFVATQHVFADVPVPGKDWMEPWIVAFRNAGVTTGCGANPLIYCPENNVTRAEMAVFLLRAKHGAGYQPPAAASSFSDVPVSGKEWMQPWIEQYFKEGLTTGCGAFGDGLHFCPENNVTRAEMAVFVLRALHPLGYQPPAAPNPFTDVPVAGKEWMAPWIVDFKNHNITTGCGVNLYCPEANVTRAEMAVFIGRAYHLLP